MVSFITASEVEVLFLTLFDTPASAGQFKVAYQLSSGALLLVPGVFGALLLPMMASALARGHEVAARRLAMSTTYLAVLTAPLVAFGVVFADGIIGLLYGAKYEPAAFAFACCLAAGAVGAEWGRGGGRGPRWGRGAPGDVGHLPGRADGTVGCVRRGLRGRDHRPALRREVRACRGRVRMLPRRGRGGRAVAGRIELPAGLGPAAHADDRRPRGLAGEGGAGRRPDPALRPDRGRGRVRHDQGAHGVGRGRPRAVPQRCAAGVEPTRASTDRGRARRRRRLDGQGLHAGPADAGRGRAVAGCGVRRRHAPARLLERGRPAASPGTACAPRQGAAVFHRPHPGLGGTTRGGCDVSLYEKTFRHLLYPGYEAVRGRRTLHYLREHEASQWLPPGQIAELQWRKLTSLVGCWGAADLLQGTGPHARLASGRPFFIGRILGWAAGRA